MQFNSMRIAKFDYVQKFKNSLSTFISDMNMNRLMFVAVEEEAKSINLKYLWHLGYVI